MGGVSKSGQPDRPIPEDHQLLVATYRELEAAGQLGHYRGQLALRMAREFVRVDLHGSGREVARVAAVFQETFEAAMKEPAPMTPRPDAVDERTVRRNWKGRGR
jgi:hypothetical protein